MAKRKSVMIGAVVVAIGDTFATTEKAAHEGHGNEGDIVRVKVIKERNDSDNRFLIGLVSEIPNGNWSNLDGAVAPGHGYYFRRRELFSYFVPIIMERMMINDSYTFRKLELQGMECNMLAFLPDGKSVFVEFDKDVGGCASDGLGKAGHCLAVPKEILKKVKKVKKNEKKT
jgi:hypothetical protein